MTTHIVKANEDLDIICRSYYAVSEKVHLIINANGFLSKRKIVNGLPELFANDVLLIP
jgi:hypothetical protein